ncbi:MAG: cadherin-like beta sandwich domain-containing protein [Leptospiraceae bacterium]|nr:cadherin-like beta sandwich domain-containing protein [Leptospiraceae bacterium]
MKFLIILSFILFSNCSFDDGPKIKTLMGLLGNSGSNSISGINTGSFNISLKNANLVPEFNEAISNYKVSVENPVTSIELSMFTENLSSFSIIANNQSISASTFPVEIPLNIGLNPVKLNIVLSDGSVKNYFIDITRNPISIVNSLSNLVLSAGTLSPSFDTNTYSYSTIVPISQASITLTPTASSPESSVITINGNVVTSGTSSDPISLNPGANLVNVLLTASNGSTINYSVNIERNTPSAVNTLSNLIVSTGVLNPLFNPGTLNYSFTVDHTVTNLEIFPTATDSNSNITINGSFVASGSGSGNLNLNFGTNSYSIIVTAQNGTSNNYSISVIRTQPSSINTLSNLFINQGSLTPTFSSGTNSYSITLPNSNTGIEFTPMATDGNSTITLNGNSINSGNPSGNQSLNVGSNIFNLVVTAQNGSQNTYTINVTRESPALTPTGLRIFVTDAVYDGNLGGVSGADSKCNSDINKPNDGSTFKALVSADPNGVVSDRSACNAGNCSTANQNRDWVIKANSEYFRSSDSARILTSTAAGILIFGSLENNISTSNLDVWTGLNGDWTVSDNCADWTSNSSTGRVGNSNFLNQNSIGLKVETCSLQKHLICVEQ